MPITITYIRTEYRLKLINNKLASLRYTSIKH
jgi:hypothetical protein